MAIYLRVKRKNATIFVTCELAEKLADVKKRGNRQRSAVQCNAVQCSAQTAMAAATVLCVSSLIGWLAAVLLRCVRAVAQLLDTSASDVRLHEYVTPEQRAQREIERKQQIAAPQLDKKAVKKAALDKMAADDAKKKGEV
jgi:hypothetical protein